MAFQDMPPPGGFGTVSYARTTARPLIKQSLWFLLVVAATFNGARVLKEHKRRLNILRVEQNEHYLAASPFFIAERERNFLAHLRNLRDDERELMKDHKGWIVGTLYGEPLYKTTPNNTLPPINPYEYWAHTDEYDYIHRVCNPSWYV